MIPYVVAATESADAHAADVFASILLLVSTFGFIALWSRRLIRNAFARNKPRHGRHKKRQPVADASRASRLDTLKLFWHPDTFRFLVSAIILIAMDLRVVRW